MISTLPNLPTNTGLRIDPPPSGPPRTPPSVPPSKPGPWSGPLLPDFPSRDQNTKPTDNSSISVPPNANGTLNPGDREFGPQNKVLGVQDTSYVTPSKITF